MLYDIFFNVLILVLDDKGRGRCYMTCVFNVLILIVVDDKGRDKCYMICFSMCSFSLL